MNKFMLAAAVGMILTLPVSALADDNDEVTIRVLELNEYSKQNVLNRIELPAGLKKQAQVKAANKQQKGDGQEVVITAGEQQQDRDRDRENENEGERDHEREMAHEMEHEHNEMESDHEPPTTPPGGNGQPGNGPNG